MPTMPLEVAGQTIEPSVSVPTATVARLAATAAPEPEPRAASAAVENVGILVCRRGRPAADERVERKFAHSERLVLLSTAPGGAQQPHQVRVSRLRRAHQRQRPGCRLHAVAGVDVVLEQHLDAVSTARAAPARFPVERVGDLQRLGIQPRSPS
jgi:hypothetical protein